MKIQVEITVNQKKIDSYIVKHKNGLLTMDSADKNKLFKWFFEKIIGEIKQQDKKLTDLID